MKGKGAFFVSVQLLDTVLYKKYRAVSSGGIVPHYAVVDVQRYAVQHISLIAISYCCIVTALTGALTLD